MQAYADWRRFGVLPHAGGSFDQPHGLLDEMRTVHHLVTRAERAKEAQTPRKRGRLGRRR